MIRLDRPAKTVLLTLADMAMVPVCLYLALAHATGSLMAAPTLAVTALLTVAAGGLSLAFGLPRIQLKTYETRGLILTGIFALILAGVGALASALTAARIPPMALISFALLYFMLGAAWRVGALRFLLWIYRVKDRRVRVAIYGAGSTGMQMARALSRDPRIEPVAFADDNPSLRRQTVAGLPVYAPADLPRIAPERGIDRVLLAMPSVPAPRQARIARSLQEQGLKTHILPSFAQLAGHEALARTLAADNTAILGRGQLDQELPGVSDSYAGQKVLITGAGGSIGAELCRQVLLCKPACLVLYEISEIALHTLHQELVATNGTRIVPILGSVADKARLARVLAEEGVDTVLHAAAYKHVPLVEGNAVAGVANNVLGTRTAAEAALAAGVRRFVLISTDKAVRPRGIMGATKRAAELVVRDLAQRPGKTRFSMVRFGNVIGSSGSVVPLFQKQIARGGPVTLTHENVTRYFMTIPEAVRLVLVAGSFAKDGDVFVLDMGEPVLIRDLAARMIELAGCTVKGPDNPDGDIEIVVTGLRPGEKLAEELFVTDDMLSTPHPKIMRARDPGLSEIEIRQMLRDLSAAVNEVDADAARAALLHWTGRDGSEVPAVAAPIRMQS